jgi:hypothetical protein
MKNIKRFILFIGFTLVCWPLVLCAQEVPVGLKLSTSQINISTFYNGTTLKAEGTIPADVDVLLEVQGPKRNVELKLKGKVAGLLWMNKTDVELENVPSVYMVYTPDKVGSDLFMTELGIGSDNLMKDLSILHAGYQKLVRDIVIKPASEDKMFIFGEYVKLMEKAGVYAVNNGTVAYGAVKDGKKPFTVVLNIPPKMSAGQYKVKAIVVKNGKILVQTAVPLTLQLSGFPKLIATLSRDHALLFGIMAVVIAVAAGLIIGMLFKGGGGAH